MNVVAHNILGMNAQRQYGIVEKKQAKTTEKLSSGYKINRAADDAAGLAVSEKMRRQIRGLTQASKNVSEAVGYVQTADGALNEVTEILQRMNELAVKASNGTLEATDRSYIDSEYQQLKKELDRTFSTTSFNERLIWDTDTEDKVPIAYEKKPTINSLSGYTSYDITDKNIHIVPKSSITIHATEADGMWYSWTGTDGNSYTTNKLDWDTLKDKNYSFKLSDFYDSSNASFFDTTVDPQKPLVDMSISFSPAKYAEYSDIARALNGKTHSTSRSSPISGRFEDSSGAAVSNAFTPYTSLNFDPAYKSHTIDSADGYDFDTPRDDVFVPTINGSGGNMNAPVYTDLASAKTDTTPLSFSFNFAGVGNVTATMSKVSYSSSDRRPETEGTWWGWIRPVDRSPYQSGSTKTISGSSISTVLNILTGAQGTASPGLLTEANGGCSSAGGSYSIYFDMKDPSGTSVGEIRLNGSVSSSDTEESVFERLKNSLNSSTILDLYTSSVNVTANAYINGTSTPTAKYDAPIFKAVNKLIVQAGSEAGQIIEVTYDSLSTYVLDLDSSNVLTQSAAGQAIDEVKSALQIVSAQRADFGAYQNRFEHTIKNLDNIVENTTAAESRIRDADMAKEMVDYSLQNILEQAGISVMAQANQSNSTVLALLST